MKELRHHASKLQLNGGGKVQTGLYSGTYRWSHSSRSGQKDSLMTIIKRVHGVEVGTSQGREEQVEK